MTKKNTGESFEKLAETIYTRLVKNPDLEKVEHNVMLEGADGARQIDVLITSETAGGKVKTVIECKDYNKKISIGTLDAFHSKLNDINANKGILISKKGFSNKTISKANRLGITLCTAHEAMEDSWNPDIDMPLLIEEVKPTNLEFDGEFRLNKGDQLPRKGFPTINGIYVIDLIKKKWKEQTLQFERKNGFQKIHLEEIQAPYKIQLGINGEKSVSMDEFSFSIRIKFRYFKTSLGELDGTQILNNITEGYKSVFMDISSIESLEKDWLQLDKSYLDGFTGAVFSAHVIPDLEIKASSLHLERVGD